MRLNFVIGSGTREHDILDGTTDLFGDVFKHLFSSCFFFPLVAGVSKFTQKRHVGVFCMTDSKQVWKIGRLLKNLVGGM